MTEHAIADGRIAAVIRAQGGELRSLRDAQGTEYLWQAGAAWPRCAPLLFPIVGRLAGDTLRHDGKSYRMTQHGFARDRAFVFVERKNDACRLALADDEATRTIYPFAFRFEILYALAEGALDVTFTVSNPGAEPLPASFGAHPAFNWPLDPGVAPEIYTLTFERDEAAPIRRLSGGLLRPEAFPTPVEGRVLRLREDLFADDAIVMDHVASASVRFAAPTGPSLEVAWEGFRELGLWMKPGARFLCIEPWLGFASPLEFDGPFIEKPGVLLIPPGESRRASMSIRITS